MEIDPIRPTAQVFPLYRLDTCRLRPWNMFARTPGLLRRIGTPDVCVSSGVEAFDIEHEHSVGRDHTPAPAQAGRVVGGKGGHVRRPL